MKQLSKSQLRLLKAKKDVFAAAKSLDKTAAKYHKSIVTVRAIEDKMTREEIMEVNQKHKPK